MVAKNILNYAKNIFKKVKNYFGFGIFISPEVNQKLSDAIDDKIAREKVKQSVEVNVHTKVLNSFLHTYFTKSYSSNEEMNIAYEAANKKWKEYVRGVNSTSRTLNLDKHAFEKHYQLVLKQIIKNRNESSK